MPTLDEFLARQSSAPQTQPKVQEVNRLDSFLGKYSQEEEKPKSRLDEFLAGQSQEKSPPSDKSEFAKGWNRGLINLKATGTGLTSLLYDAFGDQEKSDAFARGYASLLKKEEQYPSSVGQVEDIKGVGDFFDWVAGKFGEQGPNFATAIGSGGFGGLVARKVGEKVITKQLGERLTSSIGQKLLQEGAKKYAKTGAAAGTFGAWSGIETGSTYGEQIEAGVERSPGIAATAGIIKGSLDLLPFGQVAKYFGLGKVAEKGLLEAIQALPITKRVLAMTALTGATEGGTEALQEAVDIAARKLVDTNYDMLGEEARSRILNAAAAGAAIGGAMGGAAGIIQPRTETGLKLNDKDLPSEEPVDLGDSAKTAIPKPDSPIPPTEDLTPKDVASEVESQPSDHLIPLNDSVKALIDSGIISKDNLTATVDKTDYTYDYHRDKPLINDPTRKISDLEDGEVAWASLGSDQNLSENGLKPGSESVKRLKHSRDAIQKTIKNWVDTFIPGQKVALFNVDELTKERGRKASGVSFTDSNDVRYIGVDFNVLHEARRGQEASRKGLFEIMAHEFGHTVIGSVFKAAPIELKSKLYNAYREYLNKAVLSPKAWYEGFGTPIMDKSFGTAVESPLTTPEYLFEKQGDFSRVGYYLSFEEWAAQQASRYMQTRDKGRNLVSLFFKRLVQKLKAFHNSVKGKYDPNNTFAEFMDALADKRILDWTLEVRKAEVVDKRLEKSINEMVDMSSPEFEPPKNGIPRPAKFNNFMRWMSNLLQILDDNRHIHGVEAYVEATRQWWMDKTAILDKANERLSEWQLSKPDQMQFSKVLYDTTLESMKLGRKLNPQEKAAILKKHGLEGRSDIQDLYDKLQSDFENAIRMHFQVLRADAQRQFFGQDTDLQTALNKLAHEEQLLLNQDYFPLSRFGRYWVRLKALKPTRIQGELFNPGDTITFEMYETERQAKERAQQLKRTYPSHATGFSMVSDVAETFAWMPPSMIQSLMNKLHLTEEQQAELKTLLHELAPGQGFKKNLLRRRGIAGFSNDAKRTYAAYFMHFANHHARIKHFPAMNGAMKQVEDYAKRVEVGQNGISTRKLSDYIKRHYDYAMNPGEELANIRSAAFLWYLGFNVKSAMVNLTQVPLVAYPYLAARYGDVGAVKELTLAMKDMRRIWGNRGDGSLADPELEWGLQEGIRAGFLNESLATELASVAEGSNLSRLLPGTFLRSEAGAARVRQLSHWGSYLFQTAEKLNRFQVFTAAWRLAKKANPQATKEEIFTQAREAVDKTQYEYARWNRPEFMRGKKSVFFMFFNYLQNTLYFASRVPGRGRFFMALLFMAGLQGLPGAEDLMDLWDFAATKLKEKLGWDNPKTDVRLYIRELVQDLGANPDLVMNGTSRIGFGAGALGDMMGVPIPNVDLSGSLSLGRVVPGLEPMVAGTGDFNTRLAGVTEDVGGAGVGIVMSILKAMSDDNPDTWRRLEHMLPTAFRNVSKAARWANQGGEVNRSGAHVVSMDPNDPEDFFTIVAQGLGFASTEVNQTRELSWTQREHAKYWQTRRSGLMAQYDFALRMGDKEARADMRQAIRDFNKSVPIPGLVITGDDLGRSIKTRTQGRFKEELGLPSSLRETQLYQGIKDQFGSP